MRGRTGGMPRFTVKDLLISTSLIAVSFSCFALLSAISHNDSTAVLALLLWFSSGAFLGAGLVTPFRHPLVGGLVGFVLAALIWLFIAITVPL
jgi:hypothetical protein